MNEWCVGVFSFLIGTGYLASFLPSCPSVCNELCKLPFLVLSSHHYHLSYKKYGLGLSHRFTVAFFKTPFSTNQKWIAEENCWMDLSSSSPSEPPLSETRWSHLHHPHPMSLQRNHPGWQHLLRHLLMQSAIWPVFLFLYYIIYNMYILYTVYNTNIIYYYKSI